MATNATKGFYRDGSLFAEYLSAVDGVTEAPIRYHMGTALAVLGAVLGRRAVLLYGPHRLYPITPTILVGPSGIGKGEALGIGRRLLKHLRSHPGEGETMESDIWVMQDEATPQAIAKALTITPQGTPMESGDVPEIAIVAGEMATFLNKSGERENMVPVLTKLLEQDDSYARDLVKEMEKGRRMDAKDPTVSFLAGTTVEWMRKLMPNEVFSGGFMRRCILVVEAKKGRSLDWPRPLTELHIRKMANVWARRLYTKGAFSKTKITSFDMSKSLDYWKAFKTRHDRRQPDDQRLVGHYNSFPQHVLRSALSFAAAQGRKEVLPDDLRDGEAWMTSLMPDVRKILLQSETFGFEDKAQLLERLLIEHGEITRRKLWHILKCPKREFDELMTWAKAVKLVKQPRVNKETKEQMITYAGKRNKTWGR